MSATRYETQATRIGTAHLRWQTARQDQEEATKQWKKAVKAQEEADRTWRAAEESQSHANRGEYYEELQPINHLVDEERRQASAANLQNHQTRAEAHKKTINAAELY